MRQSVGLWICGWVLCVVFACEGREVRVFQPTSTSFHRIIGGAPDRRLTAVGALVGDGASFCTGSLIAKKVVLTAAHCIDSARQKKNLQFRIEIPDSSSGLGYAFKYYAADTSQLSTHSNWTRSTSAGFDVGVVVLQKAVEPGHAKPLPWNATALDQSWLGKSPLFLGYGLLESATRVRRATIKHGVQIPISKVQQDRIIVQAQGRSVCHGDSGGPALFQVGGVWTVLAVNSYVTGSKSQVDPRLSACNGTGAGMRTDTYQSYINSILQVHGDPGCTGNQDCPAGQVCQNQKCVANPCGNGTCDAAQGENCSTCLQDCPCPAGQSCQNNSCQPQIQCGDGRCDAPTENCTTCLQDCPCPAGQSCQNSACQQVNPCGNGICDAAQGENCSTCLQDCPCPAGQICEASACKAPALCGNGICDAAQGESCSTCLQDCPCPAGQACQNGVCSAPQSGCIQNTDCSPGYVCVAGSCVASQSSGCNPPCVAGQRCENGQCIPDAAPPPDGGGVPAPNQGKIGGPCGPNHKCDEGLRCFVVRASQKQCLQETTPTSAQVCPVARFGRSCDPSGRNCFDLCIRPQGAGCQIASSPGPFPWSLWWYLLILWPLMRRREP